MKLRIRFRKITKIYEVTAENEKSVTIADIKGTIPSLFGIAVNGEVSLSLNNRDLLDSSARLIEDCHLVSGDLLYVVADDKEIVNQEQMVPGHRSGCQATSSQSSDNSFQSSESSKGNPDNRVTDKTEHLSQTYSGSISADSSSNVSDGANVSMEMDQDDVVDQQIVCQCLSEPVLCREAVDGEVPSQLRELFGTLQPENELEVLGVVLHVLMLEMGFIVVDKGRQRNADNVPEQWRNTGYLRFTYSYPSCAANTCSLTVLSTGSAAAIHGKLFGSDEVTRQCSVPVSSYVKAVDADCAACYRDLAKLSRIFKDSVASPLVQDIRTASGLEDVSGLLSLVQDVKLRILSYLDVRSLLQVSVVHSELYSACNDRFLWRRLYLRDFGNRRDNSLSQDWKQLYKEEYKSRKERKKLMSRMTLITPPLWNPQNPFSGPSSWMPPVPGGIIGGDYDLYPNFPSSLPGVPGRLGPRPPTLPHPRIDLIGPGMDPRPDPALLPRRPNPGGRGGKGGYFAGFGPRFF